MWQKMEIYCGWHRQEGFVKQELAKTNQLQTLHLIWSSSVATLLESMRSLIITCTIFTLVVALQTTQMY